MSDRSTSSRHELLDAMRGGAALTVCVYHYLAWSEIAVVESAGLFAVAVFFILSALTMAMVYRPRFGASLDETNIREFFQNRVARILPLLALVASLRFAYTLLFDGEVLEEFIRFFLTGSGLFSLQMPGYLASFVGAWSLGIEILFYLVFPGLYLVTKSAARKNLALLVLFLFAGQQALIILMESDRYSQLGKVQYWFGFANLLIYAPFFAMGIFVERTAIKPERTYSWIGMGIFIMVIAFSSVWPHSIITNPLTFFVLSLASGLSVYFVFHGQWSKSWVPFFRFAGNISYALYLIHWAIWFGISAGETYLPLPLSLKFVGSILISICGAYILHLYIEVPCRKLWRYKPNN